MDAGSACCKASPNRRFPAKGCERMNIEIPYGKGTQTLHVAQSRLRACLVPSHPAQQPLSQEELVRRALAEPIGTPPLRELARGKRRVVVITSDHTRPMPSRVTLPLLLREIREGSPAAEITILVATGLHRAPTAEEMRERFGEALLAGEKIVVHNASREEDMAFFGRLPSGGELWLNSLVAKAELVAAEGFIEPHFFAGFSGGRKSILPGVAARKTVLYNHNAQFMRHPMARQGCLAGNPIHEDMAFAADKAGLGFILNVLLDERKRIVAAVAGDAAAAHAEGCAQCAGRLRVRAVEADIVVTSNGGYPLDQNLYQSVKGMTAAEACVRPGGVIIMCAALGDGHGGEAFYRWFADRRHADEVACDIENVPPERTTPDQWQAQVLARVMQRAECIFVSGEENRRLIEGMHMRFAANVDDALAEASRLVGMEASVAVIPDGVGVIVERAEKAGECGYEGA